MVAVVREVARRVVVEMDLEKVVVVKAVGEMVAGTVTEKQVVVVETEVE